MQPLNLRPSSSRFVQLVLLLAMITGLLAGCRLPWQPTDEPATLEEGTNNSAEEKAPTAEPRGDLPPALVEVSPLPQSVIGLTQPVTLTFNQAMDTASVEAAFNLEPSVAGSFAWVNDQTVTFTPDQPLAPGSTLRLRLNTRAQAVNRKALPAPVEIVYQSAETLEVLQVMPKDGTEDVDPESAVFVAFNQPVVPLGEDSFQTPAFILSPEAPGAGEWLNTSTYIFYPAPSLEGDTTYTIRLNPDLRSAAGAGWVADATPTFDFTTTLPEALAVLPLPEGKLSLDGAIEVQFNLRMDAESVEKNFALLGPREKSVPGGFSWDETQRKLTFTPAQSLRRDTTYTIRLTEEAESLGGLPLSAPIETARRSFPDLSPDPATPPVFESYFGEYGQYTLVFTTPLERETYQESLSVSPEIGAESLFLSEDHKTLHITGYFNPETTYTVTLKSDLTDRWGGKLGQPFTYSFATPPAIPNLSILTGSTAHNLVFIPTQKSELVLQATNINTVTLELSPISEEELLTLLNPDNYDYRQMFLPDSVETSTRNLSLDRNMNQIVTLPLSYQGNSLSSGIYYLGVSSPDLTEESSYQRQKLFLIVSENHLALKVAPEQTLVWATRLSDGAALTDVPIEVYTTEGDLLASGVTDEQGLFSGDFPRFEDPYTDFFAWAGNPGEEDFSFSISTWGQGYALYEQGILQDTLPRPTEAYLYTDRPIYRPGDTVHFKAVLFDRDNGIPVSPGIESLTVRMMGDPGMSGIPVTHYEETLWLSDFGALGGDAPIPADAPPGMYHLELIRDEKTLETLYFDVAAYRKPEIELHINLRDDPFKVGSTLTADIGAAYYFGVPAAHQPVVWNLYMDQAYFDLPGYQVGPMNQGWLTSRALPDIQFGMMTASGEGETDSEGRLVLTFSERDLTGSDFPMGSLRTGTLEVTLTDESGFPVSQRQPFALHPEDFYIGVQPETLFGTEESPFNFSIQTVDWDKEPVGKKPLTATFEAIRWDVIETHNPVTPYRYEAETSLVGTASPVTGTDGQARVTFTPPSAGTYRLTVQSGAALTQTVVWVSGASAPTWPRQPQNILQLLPDAETYQAGQTAQVFLPNPFQQGAQALVTVERGEIMDIEVLTLDGAGQTLSIPLTDAAAPNVYVSVLLLGKRPNGAPDYRLGVVNLPVAPTQKTLDVALSVDPSLAAPGERVTATLTVRDAQGEPVQGEFSVAVVDKALLALAPPISPPILEAFYGNQPLAVQTSTSLKTYATQLALSNQGLGQGGGNGGMSPTTLREDFPDTAFWEGTVVTGADGTARITLPLPDSLTTWVVDVRGLTQAYQVGQAEAEIITQKPLMIRPVTPRFLVEGDTVEMAAVVHNNSGDVLEVNVTLQGKGFTLTEDTSTAQKVTLEAGKEARVTWWGEVSSVAAVDLVFRADAGELHDASAPVWGELPVLRYSTPATFSASGQLTDEGQRLEVISLPISSDPSAGQLTLSLAPSLAATVIASLEALETTPYADTVSVLSHLMANLNTYQMIRRLELDFPSLEGDLVYQVDEAIRQLLEAQNFDGGWSWRVDNDDYNAASDPFITASVLLGLTQAADAGRDVETFFLEPAWDFLFLQLNRPGELAARWKLDRMAFMTYALRQSNQSLTMTMEGLYARRSELSPWASALLALTLHETGGQRQWVTTLLSDLEAEAVRSATGVHWESEQGTWALPGTPAFNTAVAVYALAQLDPASTSLMQALEYILAHRQSPPLWSSPFETAWSLMALTAALQGTGDYQADFEFQSTLNDTLVAEGTAAGPNTLQPVIVTAPMADLYPADPNALMIERGDGAGTLYYRADLQTYQPAATAQAINQGISLSRVYYLAGEGCPGGVGCTAIDSVLLKEEGAPAMVTVALTVVLSSDMYHLMIEDFIPAGMEVISPRLLTSQTMAMNPLMFDARAPYADGWGWWYFDQPTVYQDRLLWATDYVPAGTYTLTYQALPYQRGSFQTLPAHAWQYFYPEVQGATEGSIFTIE